MTVPDTFAESHLKDKEVLAGAAANQAATFKTTKYMSITTTHLFVPISIETSGAWNNEAIEIVQEIGKRITSITSDLNETNYLFQRVHRELGTTKLSRLCGRLASESHRSPVTSINQTICFNEYPLLSNGEFNVIFKLFFTRARQATRPLKNI